MSVFLKPITRKQFLKGALGCLAVSLFGVGKGYANTWKSQIRLEKVKIKVPDLPKDFIGLKIGQLTDLHSSSLVSKEQIAHAAELVMKEKPDLIVLTGDFIGESLRLSRDDVHDFDKTHVDNCVKALSILKAPLGIYAVLGNHDFWSGKKATKTLVKEFESGLGVTWLRNRHVTLKRKNSQLELLGVDDLWHNCRLDKALKGTMSGRKKILLSHNPDINERIHPLSGIDLVICGHTHGGQIVLPFIGPPFSSGIRHKKYRKGLVKDGKRQTYISRGVGHLVVPIRFNCPPEATLLTLV